MNHFGWSEDRAKAREKPKDPGRIGYSGPPCLALMGWRPRRERRRGLR